MSPWCERKSCLRARADSGMPLADSRSESKTGRGKSRREMTVTSAPAAEAPAAATAASFWLKESRRRLPPKTRMRGVVIGRLNGLEGEFSTEAAGAVVGLSAVLVDEDAIEAAVAEESAAEGAEVWRSEDPAGGFEVEVAEGLEGEVFGFGEEGVAI